MNLFSKTDGQFVKAEAAEQLTETYHQRKMEQKIPEQDCVRSEFFGGNHVERILRQPGCVGIRVKHAKRRETIHGHDYLIPRIVLVGLDAKGNEITTLVQEPDGLKDMPEEGEEGGFLMEGHVCPPHCKQ